MTNTGEKHHVCSDCGKEFSQWSQLKRHRKAHTGEKPHVCSHCGKGFSQQSNLKTHMMIHTGEKPHVCSHCGKGFIHKPALKRHVMTHNGEKPHVCSHCGKGFSQQGNLKTHMMTHTGEKPHVCSHCGKGFIRQDHLKKHMMTHRGKKPHICSDCGKSFSQLGMLKSHMTTHVLPGSAGGNSGVYNLGKGESSVKNNMCEEKGEILLKMNGESSVHMPALRCGEQHWTNRSLTSKHLLNISVTSLTCFGNFTDMTLLENDFGIHRMETHEPACTKNCPISSKYSRCQVCVQGFTEVSVLEGHIATHMWCMCSDQDDELCCCEDKKPF